MEVFEKYTDFSVGLILMGDLPNEKHESVFNIDLVKYMKVISTLGFFCEIHESDFNIGFFCEIHESDFNISLVKYMKVISTFVL